MGSANPGRIGGLSGDLRRAFGLIPGFASGQPVPVFENGGSFGGNVGVTGDVSVSGDLTLGATEVSEARLRSFGRLLDAKTAAGASFGGTGANVEAIMPGGTITIPANTLGVGDVVKGRLAVTIPATISTDEFALNLRVGGLAGAVIAAIPATDVADNDLVVFDFEIVIRTATTGYSVTQVSAILDDTDVTATSLVALTGLNLTAALTIVVTGEWSTQNANSAILQSFTAVVYGG